MKSNNLKVSVIILLIIIAASTLWISAGEEESESNEILIFVQDIETKAKFENSREYLKNSNLIDIKTLDEQKGLRLSKYQSIAVPYPEKKLRDSLKKYYDSGTGIYYYDLESIEKRVRGRITSENINNLIGFKEAYLDLKIKGIGEKNTSKPALISIKNIDSDKNVPFHIIGRYSIPQKSLLINIDTEREKAHNTLIKAIIDSHTSSKQSLISTKLNQSISTIYYDSKFSTKTVISHDLFRDYSKSSSDEFDFTIYSGIYTTSEKSFVDSIQLSLDTNEPASIISVSPQNISMLPFTTKKLVLTEGSKFDRDVQIYNIPVDIKSDVNKARQRAEWKITPGKLLPKDISGENQRVALRMITKNIELNISVNGSTSTRYGGFKQYISNTPKISGYRIVVKF